MQVRVKMTQQENKNFPKSIKVIKRCKIKRSIQYASIHSFTGHITANFSGRMASFCFNSSFLSKILDKILIDQILNERWPLLLCVRQYKTVFIFVEYLASKENCSFTVSGEQISLIFSIPLIPVYLPMISSTNGLHQLSDPLVFCFLICQSCWFRHAEEQKERRRIRTRKESQKQS